MLMLDWRTVLSVAYGEISSPQAAHAVRKNGNRQARLFVERRENDRIDRRI